MVWKFPNYYISCADNFLLIIFSLLTRLINNTKRIVTVKVEQNDCCFARA